MNTTFAIAALSLIALGVANTAVAGGYRFKDTGAFTAHGSITVTAAAVSLPCTTVLTGTTTHDPKITVATFSGLTCLALVSSNLPWNMSADAPHGFIVHGMEVSALVLGICGPGNVHTGLSKAGVIGITGAGLPGRVPCSVSGSLTTSPKLEIISKQ